MQPYGGVGPFGYLIVDWTVFRLQIQLFKQLNSRMGSQIQKQDSPFLQSLSQPILLTSDQRINASDAQQVIFHNKHISTQYFIRFLSAFPQEQVLQVHMQFLDLLANDHNSFIVPLLYYRIKRCPIVSVTSEIARVVCDDQPTLESYYLFYNFSLRQVIQRGFVSLKNRGFKEQELWYAANAMVQIIKNLSHNGVAMGGITTEDIMLTPGGQIQFYPNKLRMDNSHALFFEVIKNTKAISHGYLPPEQLNSLRKGNYILPDMANTLIAGDIFNLGMILLECIGFQCVQKYYSTSKMKVDMQMIQAKLRALKENRAVSVGMMDFVCGCLHPQPKKRLTLDKAEKIVAAHPKSRNITLISHNMLESNVFTTRQSTESTLSHMTRSIKLRNR